MRLFLLILISLFSFPAIAEESAPPQQGERVQIITDQEAGAVRIVIDGQPVAIFDATGLHVRESIMYGERITDYAPPGFDAHAAERGEAPDAP